MYKQNMRNDNRHFQSKSDLKPYVERPGIGKPRKLRHMKIFQGGTRPQVDPCHKNPENFFSVKGMGNPRTVSAGNTVELCCLGGTVYTITQHVTPKTGLHFNSGQNER